MRSFAGEQIPTSAIGAFYMLILLCQIMHKPVIPEGKRVFSAIDGMLKPIHGACIPEIHAGMTIVENSDHVI